MDTTMRPAAPDLQASLRHLRRLTAAGLLALALLGAAAGAAGPVDAAATGKEPELPVSSGLTRKVNEYEGQHRRGACCEEVPVPVPTVAGDPSQRGLAGGKDSEIPVTTG